MKYLTSLKQMPVHVVGKQNKDYIIHNKITLLEIAVNEIENHITKGRYSFQ